MKYSIRPYGLLSTNICLSFLDHPMPLNYNSNFSFLAFPCTQNPLPPFDDHIPNMVTLGGQQTSTTINDLHFSINQDFFFFQFICCIVHSNYEELLSIFRDTFPLSTCLQELILGIHFSISQQPFRYTNPSLAHLSPLHTIKRNLYLFLCGESISGNSPFLL